MNRDVFSEFALEYAVDGWIDLAESSAFVAAAAGARGGTVLDVGVGAGRTTPFGQLIASSYVGIDYSPTMIEIARQRHPGVDLRVGDARDLSGFDSASFDLVIFSYNGIDNLSHKDRETAVRECARVLKHGAGFLVCSFNKNGPLFGCNPGTAPVLPWSSRPLSEAGAAMEPGDGTLQRSVTNWRRLRKGLEDHGSWGMSAVAAHEFGLLNHFVTVEEARRELWDAGLRLERAWGADSSRPLGSDAEDSVSLWIHYLARRV